MTENLVITEETVLEDMNNQEIIPSGYQNLLSLTTPCVIFFVTIPNLCVCVNIALLSASGTASIDDGI